jgi:hypothetical protein
MSYDQQTVSKINAFYGDIEAARERYRELAKLASSNVDNSLGVLVTHNGELTTEHADVEYECGDTCPVHGSAYKKTYMFGSTMSAETEVSIFDGCKCAIAERHDPVGTYVSKITYHSSYNAAYGVAKLHAEMAKAKYR